ncbi:ribbon-helix-helix domain-containing protein [uncultured Sphingomonas sp.]|uniref:ribbon-helix-helix domain-containing protein n=1 Tax=uncultured Sphingomonas sp. TaxID=158754 RepID=UPI0025D6FDAF|nr:ribbon-helix-helix domain-containing protein [uncultured Sphingomonas sp.]
MSRKPSFANLRTAKTAEAAAPASEAERMPKAAEASQKEAATTPSERRPESRAGRKQIAGFFTPEMSFAMHMLARRQDKSLQALMAEAFNDVLRKYGESPIGE